MKAQLAWMLALCSWFPWSGVGAKLATPHEFLSCAVIIVLADGSSGSGFYWNRGGTIFLVTARHILFVPDRGADNHSFKLVSHQAILRSPVLARNVPRVNLFLLDLAKLHEARLTRHHSNHDVAVIQIGSVATTLPHPPVVLSVGVRALSPNAASDLDFAALPTKELKDVAAGSGCFFLGYATSLGPEEYSSLGIELSRPWARTGRIVRVNHRAKTLLIECQIYHGDSGGPVFELEGLGPNTSRVRLLGVASQFIRLKEHRQEGEFDCDQTWSRRGYTVVESADVLVDLTSM